MQSSDQVSFRTKVQQELIQMSTSSILTIVGSRDVSDLTRFLCLFVWGRELCDGDPLVESNPLVKSKFTWREAGRGEDVFVHWRKDGI